MHWLPHGQEPVEMSSESVDVTSCLTMMLMPRIHQQYLPTFYFILL
jgi:hypothetical protein